jgi:hypothetical protein
MPLSTAIASMSATNGLAYTNEFQQTQFALHGITSRSPGTSQILSLMKFVDLLHDAPIPPTVAAPSPAPPPLALLVSTSSHGSAAGLLSPGSGVNQSQLSSPRRLFMNAIGKNSGTSAAAPATPSSNNGLQRSPSSDGSRLPLMLPRAALGSPRNSAPSATTILRHTVSTAENTAHSIAQAKNIPDAEWKASMLHSGTKSHLNRVRITRQSHCSKYHVIKRWLVVL